MVRVSGVVFLVGGLGVSGRLTWLEKKHGRFWLCWVGEVELRGLLVRMVC